MGQIWTATVVVDISEASASQVCIWPTAEIGISRIQAQINGPHVVRKASHASLWMVVISSNPFPSCTESLSGSLTLNGEAEYLGPKFMSLETLPVFDVSQQRQPNQCISLCFVEGKLKAYMSEAHSNGTHQRLVLERDTYRDCGFQFHRCCVCVCVCMFSLRHTGTPVSSCSSNYKHAVGSWANWCL